MKTPKLADFKLVTWWHTGAVVVSTAGLISALDELSLTGSLGFTLAGVVSMLSLLDAKRVAHLRKVNNSLERTIKQVVTQNVQLADYIRNTQRRLAELIEAVEILNAIFKPKGDKNGHP